MIVRSHYRYRIVVRTGKRSSGGAEFIYFLLSVGSICSDEIITAKITNDVVRTTTVIVIIISSLLRQNLTKLCMHVLTR